MSSHRTSLGVYATWLQINCTNFVKLWDLNLLGTDLNWNCCFSMYMSFVPICIFLISTSMFGGVLPISICVILLKNFDLWWLFLRTDLVPAYVRLLRDNEAEVRIAAAGKVTKFCRILNPELAVQHILPCVKVHIILKD